MYTHIWDWNRPTYTRNDAKTGSIFSVCLNIKFNITFQHENSEMKKVKLCGISVFIILSKDHERTGG